MCVLDYQVNFRTSLSLGQQNKVPGLVLTCGIQDFAGSHFQYFTLGVLKTQSQLFECFVPSNDQQFS